MHAPSHRCAFVRQLSKFLLAAATIFSSASHADVVIKFDNESAIRDNPYVSLTGYTWSGSKWVETSWLSKDSAAFVTLYASTNPVTSTGYTITTKANYIITGITTHSDQASYPNFLFMLASNPTTLPLNLSGIAGPVVVRQIIPASIIATKIEFASYATPPYYDGTINLYVDSVTVRAVPEASTSAMFLGGLGLVGVAAWRRKRSAIPEASSRQVFA